MKKRTKKLDLNKETVATLSAPALTRAVGGKLRNLAPAEPTECTCPILGFFPRRILRFRIDD